MSKKTDPVDDVMLTFLDYLEGAAERPTLDHLTAQDRERAQRLMDSLEAGRGIDPYASRPSVEALLAGAGLTTMLDPVNKVTASAVDLTTVRDVLSAIDDRAQVDIESYGVEGGVVVYTYLDFRARFLLVDTETSAVSNDIRALVETLFDADPDTVRVGLVARNAELVTQLLSADDLGATITTPLGLPDTHWQSPLPLALAVRRMLEQSAPEWDEFDFDQTLREPLDVAAIAAAAARGVIERQAARAYRGDKARAYRSLVGQEAVFAELIARVSARGSDTIDLDVEMTRIVREAA
jgi:hypothetical protein